MSWHRTWAAKHAGNPMLLVIAGVGFTFSFFGIYKYAYRPWARRNKLGEAQAYADFLIAKENEEKQV